MQLSESGCQLVASGLAPGILTRLRETLFQSGKAGTRCLLDDPLVREVAGFLREALTGSGHLLRGSVAIQAIAFDKTPDTNWKVSWHQDLMFPFSKQVAAAGYELPVRKGGVDYARPPVTILEQLLAVRLHLDDCEETNGPLRVALGSHRRGLVESPAIAGIIAESEVRTCLAKEGELLLMRPLTLHASSQATAPKHRRVLHFVYDSGQPMPETWHRRI